MIIGAGALLAGAGAAPALAEGQGMAGGATYTPRAEPQDAWLDNPATRHRMVIDTTSEAVVRNALFYSSNFYTANASEYRIAPRELGVAIVLRHLSTAFGFNDVIWKKYGAIIADQIKLTGDAAQAAAQGNPLMAADGKKVTIAALAAKGARFAVCGMATHGLAGAIAGKTGGDSAAVEQQLRGHLVPGGVMVAAGVVAVNRAQEHGYTLLSVAE